MKIVFFDTETTGINDPYICQLGMISGEYSKSFKTIKEEKINLLFNPKKTIDEGASKITGIYNKDVEDKPIFNTFMKIFVNHIENADIVVGHNLAYDICVIENEFRRIYEAIGRPDDKEKYDKFIKLLRSKAKDTMLASIEYCKLPSQREGKYKWPKLEELHKKLFKKGFGGAHDAMADITATKECFFALVRRKILELNLEKYDKQKPKNLF